MFKFCWTKAISSWKSIFRHVTHTCWKHTLLSNTFFWSNNATCAMTLRWKKEKCSLWGLLSFFTVPFVVAPPHWFQVNYVVKTDKIIFYTCQLNSENMNALKNFGKLLANNLVSTILGRLYICMFVLFEITYIIKSLKIVLLLIFFLKFNEISLTTNIWKWNTS